MHVTLLVLLTMMFMLGSGFLKLTVGRRRTRPHELAAAEFDRLVATVGRPLAQLVADAARLRARVEEVLGSGTEMVVAVHLGQVTQRPLRRQIHDASFDDEIDGLRLAADDWLRQYDSLDVVERQLLDQLELDIEPIRELADDDDEGESMHAPLEATIVCLRKLEHEISSYRGRYR